MSRPAPNVILSRVDSNFRCEEVILTGEIYAVCYENNPIHLKTYHKLISEKQIKYKNCSFTSPTPARNIARRLNEYHNTDKFKVYRMELSEEMGLDPEPYTMRTF